MYAADEAAEGAAEADAEAMEGMDMTMEVPITCWAAAPPASNKPMASDIIL
jgi:hypothetical protein